ncbi:hypothetical protein JYT99_03290 [bacterium AH-315-E09]|nr:hypothetical protein [bacterium AH-315-L21]MBN4074935.1 hypothetical protein [bacterium AH-315-E09]
MKKSRVLTTVVLCLTVLILAQSTVYAGSASVHLDYDDSSVVSSVIGLSNSVDISAINEKTSLWRVYSILHSSQPGKNWQKVRTVTMSVGGVDNGVYASVDSANFKLELNPRGWGFVGSKAYGNISY